MIPRSTVVMRVNSADSSVSARGTPRITTLPPQSSISIPSRTMLGCPTQSNTQSAPPPLPNVGGTPPSSERTSSTTSMPRGLMKSVAPNWRAKVSLEAKVSMAMIREARATRRAWITFNPTPPTPNTTAVWPVRTWARFQTQQAPVTTPQPMRQAEVSGMSSEILTAWTSLTTVSSANTDEAAKFHAGSPPTVNGWVMFPMLCLHRVGHPVAHAAHLPQLASVVTTTWSPGATVVTPVPTSDTMPAPSCPITTGVG